MKYCKIIIKPTVYHLKPYKFNEVISGNSLTIMGVLCFELIITWKQKI